MDLLLDMKTIFITLVAGHIFTVILISAYWRDHKKDSLLSFFFLAKCVQAVAWFFLTLRNGIPDIFSISFANSLLFLGSSLECIAILKLIKVYNSVLKKVYILLTSLNIIGFHTILFFFNEESLRVAFASFGTAMVIIPPVSYLIRKKSMSFLMNIIGFLYLLVLISLTGRAVVAINSNYTMGLFTPGIVQTLSFLSLYLVMILGNTGFILLLKERSDNELVKMATFDDLTHTLNRRTFIGQTTELIKSCAKDGKPISMLLFDIDHFKGINDRFGHEVGDRVLQDLSLQISSQLGNNGLFGRYGGDEFAIFLPETCEVESTKFAKNMRLSIEAADNRGLPTCYTLSVGILTCIPEKQTEMKNLYIICDNALYKAKKKGRDCYVRGYVQGFLPEFSKL